MEFSWGDNTCLFTSEKEPTTEQRTVQLDEPKSFIGAGGELLLGIWVRNYL